MISKKQIEMFQKVFKQSPDLKLEFKKITVMIAATKKGGAIMTNENIDDHCPECPCADFYFEIIKSMENMCLDAKKFNILIFTSNPGIIPQSNSDLNQESDLIKYCILFTVRKLIVQKLKIYFSEEIGMTLHQTPTFF